MVRPARPDRLLRTGLALVKWGPTPAAGYTASAIRYPNEPAVIDELGTLTFGEVARRTNALADSLAKPGSGRATASRSCAATIAASSTSRSPAPSSAPTRCSSTRCSPAADHGRLRAGVAGGHRLRRGVRRSRPGRDRGPPALRGVDRRGVRARRTHAGGAHRPGRRVRSQRAVGKGPRRDPHVGDHGDPEGREPQAARVAGPGGGAVLEDSAQGTRAHAHRSAHVPLMGVRALHARHGPELDPRPTPPVHSRGRARSGRRARLHRAHRRAGDASADPRAPDGKHRHARHLDAARHRRVRRRRCRASSASASWTASATSSTTSTAPPRSRGRPSPRPQDLRAAPGTAGKPPRGTVVRSTTRPARGARRGHRSHLRRQRDAVRGLHGRRREGRHRRPDVDR